MTTGLVSWVGVDVVIGSADLVSEVEITGSLDGSGTLVTLVGSEEMPVPVEICVGAEVGAEGVAAVSVGINDEPLVSEGPDDVLTSVPVGRGTELSTPVPLTEPVGVIPDTVVPSVGPDVGASVGADDVDSDVGIDTIESVEVEGSRVVAPVPVGIIVGILSVGAVRVGTSEGSDKMLDTSVIMLEMTLERSGRERLPVGRSVGSLDGSEVGMPVTVGAVGPSVGSLIPEAVGVGVTSVAVGSVGLRTEVTSDTTDDKIEDTSPTTDDKRDETPGRRTVSLLVSEVGITSELVGEGAIVGLVAPVPNAVVIPTVMPLADEVSGISEERLMSLVGSTILLGIPPADPVGWDGITVSEAEGTPSVG